ncbi:MAG: efflux RND transporter periplasmic adaptor subunit [Thiohalocapsa sp.]|nr:efflux RND transporter periplasmic adaptor subunit [Thiohalocapsa sp.]
MTSTRYTGSFELFLERPSLVAGEPADLLIFLTRLADFSPVDSGELAVSLTPKDPDPDPDQASSGPANAIKAAAAAPSRPGIYRLRLTPRRSGHHRLALAWADGGDMAGFSLEVPVAASAARLKPDAEHAQALDDAGHPDHPTDHAHGKDHAHGSEPTGHSDHDHAEHGKHAEHGERSEHAEYDKHREEGEAGDSVQLTKEQQWLSDFAIAVVERRVLRGSVPATGVLRASADGDAHVTAPIDAHLRSAAGGFPYTGMGVEPGRILAYLVPQLGGEADVAGLELAVSRAGTLLELARQERERLDALWEDRSIPFREVLQARGDEEVAAAELVAARRRLAQIQRTEEGEAAGVPVRAPIGGVVARVDVAPGAFVAEGARLFHLVSPERLWLDARVAEADIGRIQAPVGAWFSVPSLARTPRDGNGQVFSLTPETGARLVAYGAMVDPESRTVPVIFEFAPVAYPNGERLRVGQSVSARVYTGEKADTLVVPAGALVNDAGADVIYVQVAGDRFERRPVHTGLRDGDLVGVHDGVREGERVVSRGAYLVHLAAGAEGGAGDHHGHDH